MGGGRSGDPRGCRRGASAARGARRHRPCGRMANPT